ATCAASRRVRPSAMPIRSPDATSMCRSWPTSDCRLSTGRTTMNHEEIRERFAALRAEGKRHKDAAEALGISEGEAIAAHAGEHGRALRSTALRGPWIELLQSLEPCGPVLALTRNVSTVHEKRGVYQNLSGSGQIGLAVGEEIDLRLFFS